MNNRVRTATGVSPLFARRTKSVVMSLQTIKEGHLYKRGKINTEWRMRMFVLNGKQLAYFKGGVSLVIDCTELGLHSLSYLWMSCQLIEVWLMLHISLLL